MHTPTIAVENQVSDRQKRVLGVHNTTNRSAFQGRMEIPSASMRSRM
nr:hypothetical protein [Ktedonobacter racemifer]